VRFASTAFFGATPCGMGKAGSAKAFATCLLLQCQDGSEKIVFFLVQIRSMFGLRSFGIFPKQ